MPISPLPDFLAALPEIFLAAASLALLILGAFQGDQAAREIAWLAVAALVVDLRAGRWRRFTAHGPARQVAPLRHVRHRRFRRLRQGAGADRLGAARSSWRCATTSAKASRGREYAVLVLLATTGMMMMISANDLISLYVSLELQSLRSMSSRASHRDSERSTEAGLKYFVLGALASGMLLYGASMVYGFAGTTSFDALAQAVRRWRHGVDRPHHRHRASSRSASPSRSRRCRSTCGRPMSMRARRRRSRRSSRSRPRSRRWSLFVRVMVEPFGGLVAEWRQVIWFISVASMLLGAFAAINQSNIKRLMAYSSIGHVGYALIGLAAGSAAGVRGVLVYHGDLSLHECRHLRRHPLHAARRQAWSRRSPISPACRAPSRRWPWRSASSCSRWPAFRRSPASSASSMSSSPPSMRGFTSSP